MNFKYKIKNPCGVHARPAGRLVDFVKNCNKKYDECEIKIGKSISADCKCDDCKDASQILSVMSLGLKKGDEAVFYIDGPNEQTENEIKSEIFSLLSEHF